MFLKSITIKGFKSFADRVKVDFEPAITGIIGPNGSGKSNISDAIRWVLGEQSAKTLRGGKMEDVIFAGSGKRRALGLAEVTLTLDNRDGALPIDYKEVTVGRRVTRSGESDYLINNNSCRLKEIKELFMDTGIGKDAYSIIGQGKVEAILSENSVDRRELFEEAAGISKHKSRKEEAKKKLDSTEQKLQRIKDIIHEIQRQVEPLEKESKKAREYQEYRSELKELEVNLLANMYLELEEKLDQDITSKQRLSYQLTEAKSAVSEYDLRIDKEKERLEELTVDSDQQKDNIFEAKSSVERIENKLNLAKQQQNNILEQKNRLENEISRLEDRITLNKEEISKKDDKEIELVEKIKEKSLLLDEKNRGLDNLSKQLEEKFKVKKSFQDNQLNQITKINRQQHQLETASRDIKRYQEDIAALEELKESLNIEVDKALEKMENKKSRLEEIKDRINDYHSKHNREKSNNNQLQSHLSSLRDEYEEIKDSLNTKRSRLKVLEGMEENYEGYYRGVKNLFKYIEESAQIEGVCGVIAELINTPQEYETAIEVSLGSTLQNVVVEDDQVAKEAIEYLKTSKGGRATFLPLNLISSRSLNQQELSALNVEGAIGVAKDLISYDSKYRNVIENLLGRVVIARDIDAAVKISRVADKRVKVVTLGGDVVNPGGAMTGGSRNQNNNLLGRSREIGVLSSEVKKLATQLKEREELGLKVKESLVESEDRLVKLEDRIHQLELEEANYLKDYQQTNKEVERLRSELADKDSNIKRINQEILRVESESKELSQALSRLNNDDSSIKEKVIELEAEIKKLEEKKDLYTNESTELKVTIAALKQERGSLSEELASKERAIAYAKDEINSKKEEINRLGDKDRQLIFRKQELEKEKEEMSKEVVRLKNLLDEFRIEISEIKDKIKSYQQESKDIRARYERLQKEYNKVEIDVAQLQVKLENIQSKLQEEYELSIEQASADIKKIADHKKVEREINSLKRSMKRLEPVNLGAIEEYETLSKRFNFLQEQHQDLVESKESLEEVIKEIEDEMKEKFLETFNQVKAEFEKIFTDLFEGGQAQLALEDEDNLLETGIEINAQPPGKKLQKLSLMSGGEKALTATALIFSLLKVNPSPFYVLDELDAPLDDANVDRFANYLNQLSKIAQFIVITHRKGTMAAANALYGVTMQESGVSQLLSLKVDEVGEYEK
ncbi:chromosome segregation protein SMC [Orenia metallireducens]|uniref:Chromosome partition protein Smc n=1 Tax=Orenia metallireducens TaxID=1413210 RepID=A0A1C0A9S1_9FIRM|nr:chromosome segregation protein SMC [Orenia metallireducens]OCL27047.1 chromosome segregation protein SMC [Orenia metallireducens]